MAVDIRVRGGEKSLSLSIGYDDVAEWGEDFIKMQIRMDDLLAAILPLGCLVKDDCAANIFLKEAEQERALEDAKSVLALPPAVRRPAPLERKPVGCGTGQFADIDDALWDGDVMCGGGWLNG